MAFLSLQDMYVMTLKVFVDSYLSANSKHTLTNIHLYDAGIITDTLRIIVLSIIKYVVVYGDLFPLIRCHCNLEPSLHSTIMQTNVIYISLCRYNINVPLLS